jgi:hypothetical protein
MGPCQIRVKWVKLNEGNQYFVKVSEKKWHEYHESNLYAEFEEISNVEAENQSLILKRNDGYFVKLTDGRGYFGSNQSDISSFFTDGKWENSLP